MATTIKVNGADRTVHADNDILLLWRRAMSTVAVGLVEQLQVLILSGAAAY